MATQKVDITVPAPLAFIDRDAARLEAKKTLIPGATDAHGTRIVQAVSLPSDYGTTTVTVEVLTA